MKVALFADHKEWKAACIGAVGVRADGATSHEYNRRAIAALQTIPMFHASASYRQNVGYDVYAIICPACGVQGNIPIEPAPGHNDWRISGLPDAITLSPSVWCRCGPDAAHFWVENGQYRQA